MSAEYEASTARLFGKFLERGYVYKGLRPVYWCIHDQTALAEAEVEYREHTSPSVYVKFPLKVRSGADRSGAGRQKNVFVVIWTTTPWTLPANLGIAVHPDFDYSAIEVSDAEVLLLRRNLANAFAETCGFAEFEEIARFKGSKLDRLEARHAWLDRVSLIMNGDHVTLGEADAEVELDVRFENKSAGKSGTGCVHTAPGHGADDFAIGKKYGLEIYAPVDAAGRFTAEVEHWAGEDIFTANPKIVEFLRESGRIASRRELQPPLSALLAMQESGHLSRDAAMVYLDGCRGQNRSGGLAPRKRLKADRAGQMASRVGRRPDAEYVQGPARLVRLAPAFLGRADPGVLLPGV